MQQAIRAAGNALNMNNIKTGLLGVAAKQGRYQITATTHANRKTTTTTHSPFVTAPELMEILESLATGLITLEGINASCGC